MHMKLFDSELSVMELLWEEGDLSAANIARKLNDRIGWNRNTTYTVIKKLIAKNAIVRIDPGFICQAIVQKVQVQQQETSALINKFFGGSAVSFLASFFSTGNLSEEEILRLRKMIDEIE